MQRFAAVVLLILLISPLYAADFYVATSGTDAPDRGDQLHPFRTISYAAAVSDTTPGKPHSIILGKGTWTRSDELFPISFPDSTTLTGNGIGRTILDGLGQSGNVLTFAGDTLITIEDLTVTGGASPQGGGIIIGTYADQITLQGVEIRNCVASSIPGKRATSSNGIGGGLLITDATNITLRNCLLRNNSADYEGGAIAILNSSPLLSNLTVTSNGSNFVSSAASISATGGATVVKNSIVWGNSSLGGEASTISGDVTVSYSDVENSSMTAWAGIGNVWGDPLFADAAHGDFSVLEGAITVDAGDPADNADAEPAPNGNVINMGMFGGTSDATISGSNFTMMRNSLYFIGVPVETASEYPDDVFGDDFGTTRSDSTWEIFLFGAATPVQRNDVKPILGISTNSYPIKPGYSYILRQRQAPAFTVNADGHALRQDTEFTRMLPDAVDMNMLYTWSYVANPYPYPIQLQRTAIDGVPFTSSNASQWALVMRPDGRFTPTIGALQPWQGAMLINADGEWQVSPDRDVTPLTSPLESLDWVLQVDFGTIPGADTLAQDDGHLFGLGPNLNEYYDKYDAANESLFDSVLTAQSIPPVGSHALSLFHDFKPDERSSNPVWTWYVRGDDSLPDSIEVTIAGIDTNAGMQYPDSTIGLFAAYGDYRSQPEPAPLVNLREQFSFQVPFPLTEDGARAAYVTIWADSVNWNWNSTPEDRTAGIPARFAIENVYPNPFNPSTTVKVAMPQTAPLTVKVFDILGREVGVLANGVYPAGVQKLTFDGTGHASGIYFIRASSKTFSDVRKIVLLR